MGMRLEYLKSQFNSGYKEGERLKKVHSKKKLFCSKKKEQI